MRRVFFSLSLLAAAAANAQTIDTSTEPEAPAVYSLSAGAFMTPVFNEPVASAIAVRAGWDASWRGGPGLTLSFTRADEQRGKYQESALLLRGIYRLGLVAFDERLSLSLGLELGTGYIWQTSRAAPDGYSLTFSGGPVVTARVKVSDAFALSAEVAVPWVMTQYVFDAWAHLIQPTATVGIAWLH